MASTPLEFDYNEGETLTADLSELGVDNPLLATGLTVTPATNRGGVHTVIYTGAYVGLCKLHVKIGAANVVNFLFNIVDTTAIHYPVANVGAWRNESVNVLVSGCVDSLMGAVTDGVLTAAKFAAGAFDAVWSVTERLLTAGTNIALAKGTGVTGFNDLSAAQVNAEADTALADYDGPTHVEMTTALAAADDAVLIAIATLNNLSSAGAQSAAAAALTAYGAALQTTALAVKAKTDLIPAGPAAVGDIPTTAQIATAVVARALSGAASGVGDVPTLEQALYMILQRITNQAVIDNEIRVYRVDGTTLLFTLALESSGDGTFSSSTRET